MCLSWSQDYPWKTRWKYTLHENPVYLYLPVNRYSIFIFTYQLGSTEIISDQAHCKNASTVVEGSIYMCLLKPFTNYLLHPLRAALMGYSLVMPMRKHIRVLGIWGWLSSKVSKTLVKWKGDPQWQTWLRSCSYRCPLTWYVWSFPNKMLLPWPCVDHIKNRWCKKRLVLSSKKHHADSSQYAVCMHM